MVILEATNNDRHQVLDFCQNTFSWGDYIAEIWDYWISEGHLLVIHEDKSPVAMCHASYDAESQNMWIEGIRVHPQFRRLGHAKNLILHCEKISKEKNCKTTQMLVETNNSNSLQLSKTQGYKIKETWDFYSLENSIEEKQHEISFIIDEENEKLLSHSNFHYVDSWRWYPITKKSLFNLIKDKQILFTQTNNTLNGVATLIESQHFDKTLLVTLLMGDNVGISNILSYVLSISKRNNYKRIQILTNLKVLPNCNGLEKKLSFHLVEKNL